MAKPAEPEEPEVSDADDAAAEAAAAAQDDARRSAADRGVGLTDAQLEQIGRTAAEETHRLFEQSGAFVRHEPAPPPPPPDAGNPADPESAAAAVADEPPRKKASWASKVLDT